MNNQELYLHAKEIIPGGTHLFGKRPEHQAPGVFPPYFKAVKGCYVTDYDGRELLDFTSCGIGACLLGANDDEVTEAVIKVIRDGNFSTLNPPEEVELADRLLGIHPWSSWAKFARSGGEVCGVAARIARAATGKSKIMVIGYHGCQDWYLATNLLSPEALNGLWLSNLSPYGVPKELTGTAIPCMHGDTQMFNDLLKIHGNDLAAVFVEPCRHELPEPGFLEALRAGCDKYGAMLVYDEITIGWRYCFGGSHLALNRAEPDIAVFSKAMGNGHPVAAVIGNDRSRCGADKAFLSSTYWTERSGSAAALATINKMERTQVHKHVNAYGEKCFALWKAAGEKTGLPVKITSKFGCLATFSFETPYPEVRTLFVTKMLERGILVTTAFYPTLSHGDREFEAYSQAVYEVFAEIADLAAQGEAAVKAASCGPVTVSGFGRLVK